MLRNDAAIFWDETSGDLSNSQSSPTGFTLASGENSVVGSVGSGDSQDWLRLTIPAGLQLSSMILSAFNSPDDTAFTGVQNGSTFAGNPGVASSYMGYTHFGTGPGNVGENLLAEMGTANGAQGFTPPLSEGDYTFLIQQANTSITTTYQFDYTVTPVPEPRAQVAIAFLCGLAFLFRKRFSAA
jgi:hypothetical protein